MKKYLYLIKNSKISTYLKYWLMYSSKKISLLIQSLPITLENTIKDLKIVINKIYGNSEQNTTTGKNLLNTINANTTTINGVTSYRNNGFYYLSGTNTKTDATWILPNTQNTNLPTFEIGQTYTMSFKGTLPRGIYAQLNGVKTSTGTQYSIGSVRNTVPSVTFTIDSDYSSTAQLFVGVQGTTTNVDCNFAIQIEKGSTATSYEPYTGGQPSPSPDYPQEIRNVTGDVEVVVQNKNLFDASERTFDSTYNGDFVLIKDRNSKWYGYIDISKVKFPLTFSTFIYNSTSNISDTNLRISLRDKNKKEILFKTGTSVTSSNKKSVVTILQSDITDEMKYLTIGIRVQDGGYTENTQIEYNSASTDYTPHQEQVLPLTLGNIELCKIGDYQDYFYKESNKWYLHKEIGKYTIPNNIGGYNSDSNWYYIGISQFSNIKTNSGTEILCNYLQNINLALDANIDKSGIYNIGTHIVLRNIDLSSTSDYQTWISNNKILYSLLATPTDTEITDTTLISQLEEISKILSYQGQTNISSNQNIYLDIDYIKRG